MDEIDQVKAVGEGGGWRPSAFASRSISRMVQVVDALREAIVVGEIPVGTQLKQDVLAELFDTSPGPVREALAQLASEGIVEHFPNRGSFVSTLSTEELLQVLLPMRLAAESYAIKRVALSPQLSDQLETQICIMDDASEKDDLGEMIEADIEFHKLIVEAAGSNQVLQLWGSVLTRIRAQLYRLSPLHSSLRQVADEHRELLSAIRSGDRDLMDRTLVSHIVETPRSLLGVAPTNHA